MLLVHVCFVSYLVLFGFLGQFCQLVLNLASLLFFFRVYKHIWYTASTTTGNGLRCWMSNMYAKINAVHYDDVITSATASQITSLTIVYSIVYSAADQRKHQNSVSMAFVRGIHRGPVNSPHKWPVKRKMFPFDDVIMRHPASCYFGSCWWQVVKMHIVCD